ncbi:MAG: hypothetical protein CV087_22340 [Candidatus Brocadia sp. WS118]|nr:MAG: hypothetical protein CV087_22340 [Candidatus Brocadia sp. WS118]
MKKTGEASTHKRELCSQNGACKDHSRRKHDYPKTRKRPPVDTNSQKYRLLQKYSLEHIHRTWQKHGMYKTAKLLDNANPYVIFHLARDHKWRRKLPDHLRKAYEAGNWKLNERYFL